jgi:hypothetical protein
VLVLNTGLAMLPVSPMAYCDHFALRKISEDETLSAKLAAAPKASGGTLALSWLNLGEYATVTDRKQRLEAERMLDRILPSVFPIDVDPSKVSKRERAGELHPHADLPIGALFVRKRKLTISASGIGLSLSASGLFERLNCPVLIRSKDRLARLWLKALNQRREDYATKPKFRKLVSDAIPAPAATCTEAIVRTLIATFFPDQRRVLKLNDAIDFLHAAVPVTFCDAVLLDGAMWDAVERARRRLPGVKMAAVYAGRSDGIERFLAHLQTGRSA